MGNAKVAVIVVNFNKKEILYQCLDSINKQEYENYSIIVVDNNSTDGSPEMVKDNFPNAIIIETGYNSGFCTASNVGIRHALENDFYGAVILNNDTELDKKFLSEIVNMYNSHKKEKVGMIAPLILLPENGKIDAAGQYITPDGFGKVPDFGSSPQECTKEREVFCAYGAGAFYSAELLKDIEMNGSYLDDDFEVYLEDLDLGWRARLRGWKCMYDPNAVMFHHEGVTIGRYSQKLAYLVNRNALFNIIKNYPGLYLYQALFLYFFKYPVLLFLFLLGRGPAGKFGRKIGFIKTVTAVLEGWKNVILNLRTAFRKRKETQQRKKVDKREIKRWFKSLSVSFLENLLDSKL